jgi:GNAT superfamily N-acetyltransferase
VYVLILHPVSCFVVLVLLHCRQRQKPPRKQKTELLQPKNLSMSTTSKVDIRVTQLKRSDVPEAAAVMARAFCNSSSYGFILTKFDTSHRVAVLEWLFHKNLQLLFDRCPSICKCARLTDGSDKIVATLMWTPKEHGEIDHWTMIRYGGALELPFRLGWTGLKNLLTLIEDFKRSWSEVMKSLPGQHASWINLERMTVLPEYQGKGIGSAALRQALEETTGLVRLSTQEERNVRFYERLGFKVVGERDFGEETNTYHSWFMILESSCE